MNAPRPVATGSQGGVIDGNERRARPLADAVLRLIWQEQRISRAEIARRMDLSRSTASELVSILLAGGLVAEVGSGPSSGGRKPIVLEFQDDACVILGVEMGATHVAVALTNLRGEVLAWQEERFAVREDPVGTRALIARLCEASLAKDTDRAATLVGICVGVPSPVDPSQPGGLSEIVLPSWKGEAGLEFLSETYQVPVWMDNDANLGALAERWWGVGRGIEDLAYIKIGTGIGSGHVVGGQIYRGAKGIAGEIGHLVIDPHAGAACVCGLRGCLVTLVGSVALVKRANEILADHPTSRLTGVDISVDAIQEAALSGDAAARLLVDEIAAHLGTAVAGMVNLMNPSRVVLGGGLTRLGELLLGPMRGIVQSRTLVGSIDPSNIVMSKLGSRSIAAGAATLVLQTALADPRYFPSGLRSAATRR